MEKTLQRVAIAAGAGPPPERRDSTGLPVRPSSDDILDLEPLLDRIEVLERSNELAATAPDNNRLADLELQVEAVVAQKLAARIEPLERTLANQAAALDAMRERIELTDKHLQQLIAAIERLLDRDAGAASGPAAANAPFQDHLEEALSAGTAKDNIRRRFA